MNGWPAAVHAPNLASWAIAHTAAVSVHATPERSVGANPAPATPVTVRVVAFANLERGAIVHAAAAGGERTVPLRPERIHEWAAETYFDAGAPLELRLGVRDGNAKPTRWDSTPRDLPVPPATPARGAVLALEDASVRDGGALRTAAFTRVLFKRSRTVSRRAAALARAAAVDAAAIDPTPSAAVVLGVCAPRVAPGHAVFAVLDSTEAGAARSVPLADAASPLWTACVPLPLVDLVRGLQYRFVIKDAGGKVVAEEDKARTLRVDKEMAYLRSSPFGTAPVVLANVNSPFRYSRPWRGAGVALPVFSIRTRKSCGVGEFSDLFSVVDWCVATGLQLLQLLPVNDTTSHQDSRDTYAYSCVSCFALHPQYLCIEELGELPADVQVELDEERERLNGLDKVDYVGVMRVKERLTRRMYMEDRERFLKSAEFVEWFSEEQQWLVPYALFRFFMSVNGTCEYEKWGSRSTMTADEMERLAAPDSFHFDYLGAVYYTQFHLHKQLTAASRYAAQHQVVLKGDLPIGVNRFCADTWLNPHLFRLHMRAGAPPDYFSEDGQNWDMPTYDWDAMKADGYAWWRLRLGHMARYFHAYRIDHILAFFRIWEIPLGFRTASRGRFRPAITISRKELEARGLWDIDRFCAPFVRDSLLEDALGEDWWRVKDRFFDQRWHDRLAFQKDFDNEIKVAQALQTSPGMPAREAEFDGKVRRLLISLLNNVCLLRDAEDPDAFHPRFMLKTTTSYRDLPSEEWRKLLLDLHDDYYYQRQESLWRESALEKLPMLAESSDMLMCGEDLGFVPKCMPQVLRDIGILSLAVQRMPPGDLEFGDPTTYEHQVIASTSSHDISTLRAWWMHDLNIGARSRYWNTILRQEGAPPKDCSPSLVRQILSQHLASAAMWVVTPIQDLLALDDQIRRVDPREERINNPANPAHVWNFRLHIDMHSLLASNELTAAIATLNRAHGRGDAY